MATLEHRVRWDIRVSKLWSADCFCVALKLRIIFTYLKRRRRKRRGMGEEKRERENIQQTVCGPWPKIFMIWSFTAFAASWTSTHRTRKY